MLGIDIFIYMYSQAFLSYNDLVSLSLTNKSFYILCDIVARNCETISLQQQPLHYIYKHLHRCFVEKQLFINIHDMLMYHISSNFTSRYKWWMLSNIFVEKYFDLIDPIQSRNIISSNLWLLSTYSSNVSDIGSRYKSVELSLEYIGNIHLNILRKCLEYLDKNGCPTLKVKFMRDCMQYLDNGTVASEVAPILLQSALILNDYNNTAAYSKILYSLGLYKFCMGWLNN